MQRSLNLSIIPSQTIPHISQRTAFCGLSFFLAINENSKLVILFYTSLEVSTNFGRFLNTVFFSSSSTKDIKRTIGIPYIFITPSFLTSRFLLTSFFHLSPVNVSIYGIKYIGCPHDDQSYRTRITVNQRHHP